MDDLRRGHASILPTPAVWEAGQMRRRRLPEHWRRFAAVFAATFALGMLMLLPSMSREDASHAVTQHEVTALSDAAGVRLPAQVTTGLPSGAKTVAMTYSEKRLWGGKLLFIDREHPIPAEAAPPNTFGILKYSTGRLTCRDTSAVTSEETLKALDELFAFARKAKINLFTIFSATRSGDGQRQKQIERFTQLAQTMTLNQALEQALKEIPDAGCSEHQQGWSVDIRICDAWNRPPRTEALSASEEGRWLLDNCWRFGFVHRYDDCADADENYHFRFVGKAHAAMMNALSVGLEEYLIILHTEGALTLWYEDGTPNVTVLCAETPGTITVDMPIETTVDDVSMDNTGWAVMAYSWGTPDK